MNLAQVINPGHAKPSPVFGGGGAVIRDGGGEPQSKCLQIADHDLKSKRAAASLSPSAV
jgi:hypothetical protein